jgi:hypothetical protein
LACNGLSAFTMAAANEVIDNTICVTGNQVLEVVTEFHACYSSLVLFYHMYQVLAGFNFFR